MAEKENLLSIAEKINMLENEWCVPYSKHISILLDDLNKTKKLNISQCKAMYLSFYLKTGS